MGPSMKRILILSLALVLGALLVTARPQPVAAVKGGAPADRPEIAYLETINALGPPQDPQLLFILMGEYANANQAARGVAFLSARLQEFTPRMTDVQKALYLSAIALLRAQNAASVPLWQRIGYVNDTFALLGEGRQLPGGQVYVVNWIAGVVDARLPGFFGQGSAAREHLDWCAANADRAPHAGWSREVYRQLALFALADGNKSKA